MAEWHMLPGWLRRRIRRYSRRGPAVETREVDDLPDDLESGVLFIVGLGQARWCAALLCPCGCGDLIQLNLLADVRPNWDLTLERSGRPSLEPSVWRTRGCRSHFWILGGYVYWAGMPPREKSAKK